MVDKIFGYFLRKPDDDEDSVHKRIAFAKWFCSAIPEAEFTGADRVFYHFSNELQKLGLPLERDNFFDLAHTFLRPYLIKHSLKIPGTESFSYQDPTQIRPIVEAAMEVLNAEFDLIEVGDYSIENFPVEAKLLFNARREKRLMDMFLTGSQLMHTPEKGVGGTTGALEYVSNEIARIKVIYDDEKLKDIGVFLDESGGQMSFVSDFGLKTIDDDCGGGLYTKQLFSIEGGPGSGKTKFAVAHCMYRAAVMHMRNVLYFAIEQSVEEIKALLISHHLFQMYNIRVADSWILKNLIEDDDVKKKVEAARYDLFESGNYGVMHIVSGPLLLNDMADRMDVLDTLFGPFAMIVVDYMFMLSYQYVREIGFLDTTEVVRRGYRNFKAYLLRKNKTGIGVNQFNRDGVEASRADKDIDETMGAGGAEVYRSTDYNIAITASKAMEAQKKRRLQNPKKRGTAGYGSILCSVALDVSYYYEEGGEL